MTKYHLFGLLFVILVSTFSEAETTARETPPFEGRIEYRIMNEGVEWDYSFWIKGTRWRAELRQNGMVYELRLGDTSKPTAYLVNEGGKTYHPLFFNIGPPPGQSPKSNSKYRSPVILSKSIVPGKETSSFIDHDARLDIVKGPGSRMNLWLNCELGAYSGYAIPQFKKTQDKIPIFVAYFSKHQGMPLAIEERGKSSKKAFSMKIESIHPMSLEESFLTLPENYKPQGRRASPTPNSGRRDGQRNGKGRGGQRQR